MHTWRASEAGSLLVPMPYSSCWIERTICIAASAPSCAATCAFVFLAPRLLPFFPSLGEAVDAERPEAPGDAGGGAARALWSVVDGTLELALGSTAAGGGGALGVTGAEGLPEPCLSIACCTALRSSG